MKKFLALLAGTSLFALTACGTEEPAGPAAGGEAGVESENLTTDGWIKFAVPSGWSELADEGQEDWSVQGWSAMWQNDADETQVLLVNGEYGEDGALQAVGVLGSDPYFGGIPGYRSEGETWLDEAEAKADPAIRRLDFVYGEDGEGTGVMWFIENPANRQTGAVVVKGENLDSSTISEIEESLQTVGE